jgi:transcriptional regulator with XRE-family HTH domain
MAAGGLDPTVHRRRLRSELRRAREAAGFSQRDVAKAMDWSLSKLLRIETGSVSITTNDLKVLLAHYGISDQARVDALLEGARASRERSWWSVYRDVASPEHLTYLGFESSASLIRNFEPLLVPGLLQTDEYAREVITAIEGPDPVKVDALVDLRIRRQELLARSEPPGLHFILDEAVIRRVVGGPDLMRGQLRYLKEMAARPNIAIRIVPFRAGMYPRLRVPFVIIEFPDPEDEDVLIVENPAGSMIIRESSPDDEADLNPVIYLQVFFTMEQLAPRQDTIGFLDDAIAQLPSVTRSPLLAGSERAEEEKVAG